MTAIITGKVKVDLMLKVGKRSDRTKWMNFHKIHEIDPGEIEGYFKWLGDDFIKTYPGSGGDSVFYRLEVGYNGNVNENKGAFFVDEAVKSLNQLAYEFINLNGLKPKSKIFVPANSSVDNPVILEK